MSGALTTFGSLLQQAFWRGVPFYVDAQQVQKGRKTAIHDYPFRDGGWVEDMGRQQRVFRFTGHLLGDLAPAMQLALDAACEIKGPGLLIHPTLGAINVALLTASTSISKDRLRAISVEFAFMEQGASLFPSIVTSTINKVIGSVSDALGGIASDLAAGAVVLAAASGLAAIAEGSLVTQTFSRGATAAASDPAALVALATAIPAPDDETTYGRYAAGNAIVQLPVGTTVADLQAQAAAQRSAVTSATTVATTAANVFDQQTAPLLVTAISGVIEAARSTMNNPADQVRTLADLATFNFTDTNGGAGLSGNIATVRDAVASTCRRCALTSLALASASYQPKSYDDAVALRAQVAAALDVEITAAGDAGEDSSYIGLKSLRASVIQDLTTRGASLPLVETLTMPTNLPSLVAAYRIYRDASRSDQIVAETNVVHPAFLPIRLQVLAA
jgi:prophage DNA circulation protein